MRASGGDAASGRTTLGSGFAGAQLAAILKDLHVAWNGTSDSWNDEVREGFGRAFVEPLDPLVASAQRAFFQMEELRSKAVREC